MTTVLPFSNNTITVYKYEPFSYTISNSNYPTINPTVTVSTGIPSSLVVNNLSNVVFASGGGYNGGTSASELITIDISSAVSSNTVTINPGRFRDASGASFSNTVFTFYKNEPITPVTLTASISLLSPLLTFPALPAGLTLTKTDSNQFTLAGTPVTQTPASNYQIIGQGSNADAGKIVTTVNSIAIAGERLQLTVTGTPVVSGMLVDTPISQRKVTASFPLASGPNLRYTWDALPSGLYFGDVAGTSQASGFQPLDASYTLTLQGTPTVGAAKSFVAAGITSYTTTVQALRLTTPTISNSTFFTFQFAPTILFDDVTIPTFYTDISLNPTQTSFFAKTYFGTDASITTIFSPDLRSDLSLSFVSNQARAYLVGTPLSAGTNVYTIRASNTSGLSRDLAVTIPVSNTSIAFDYGVTPAVDTCYNYILSRPSSSAKTGYYPASVQFRVTTLPSTLPFTITTSDLVGTGLSLDASGNTAQLTGLPDTVTSLKTVTVTAASTTTTASASTTIKLAVVNDQVTFADVSAGAFAFVQNREITPIQLQATAVLSERPITSYSAVGLPAGLGISSGGKISGTPLSDSPGTAIITASTGYASGTASYPFTMTPDSILFRVGADPNARTTTGTLYTYQAGDSIALPIEGQTYSGVAISRYDLSMTNTLGLSINSNGLVSGPWTSGVPPSSALYPTTSNFFITATGGLFTGALPASLTASPIVSNVSVLVAYSEQSVSGGGDLNGYWSYNGTVFRTIASTGATAITGGPPGATRFKTTTTVPNFFMGYGGHDTSRNTILNLGRYLDSTSNFETVTVQASEGTEPAPLQRIGGLEHKPGSSTWWIAGSQYGDVSPAMLFKTTTDGQTWGTGVQIEARNERDEVEGVLLTRDQLFNADPFSRLSPYVYGGVALGYDASSGVLLAGGLMQSGNSSVFRSADEGATWQSAMMSGGGFRNDGETAAFSLDHPSVWVATGSSLYRTASTNNAYTSSADTIVYSTDQGSNWTVASGGFNMFGYDVVYGSNAWLATGVSVTLSGDDLQYTPEVRFSTDGSNWTLVDLSSSSLGISELNTVLRAPLRISTPMFNGTTWTVFVVTPTPTLYRFQHGTTSSLQDGWSSSILTVPSGITLDTSLRLTAITPPGYLYTAPPPTDLSLSLTTVSGSGPTITMSPTEFRLYQYIAISPIQVSATGTGSVLFFVLNADLPQGLTFNPATNRITGTPAKLGRVLTPIYAKDDNGVTKFILTFETFLPTIQKVQTSASAFTSLLRQYTIVNAAQNARDNRVFPDVDRLLGEFTAPYPPDVTTQTVDPRCFNPKCE